MIPSLVSDGIHRKSLSVTRSLGKKNIPVYVESTNLFSPSFWSKFCTKKIYNLNKNRSLDKILNNLFLKQSEPIVFFPMEESTIKWLSENEKFVKDKFKFAIPNRGALDLALSKSKTMIFAESIGINTPKTYFFKSYLEMDAYLKKNYFLLKKQNYLIKPDVGTGSKGIIYLSSHKYLKLNLKLHWEKFGRLLLQEQIPGNGDSIGVSILLNNGDPIAYFSHKRLNTFPNSGGPSTDRVGISNPDLEEKSLNLLKKLKWHGVAMVEWKVDPLVNTAYLLEINPRFWGSLELAIRSGVDFPYLYYQMCIGTPKISSLNKQIGIRTRWVFPGEILRYLTQSKRERENFGSFIYKIIEYSEEWDKSDIQGSLAAISAPIFMVFQRKFWSLIFR